MRTTGRGLTESPMDEGLMRETHVLVEYDQSALERPVRVVGLFATVEDAEHWAEQHLASAWDVVSYSPHQTAASTPADLRIAAGLLAAGRPWKEGTAMQKSETARVPLSADEVGNLTWQKSSFSNGAGGMCLEISAGPDGKILLRESDRPTELIATDKPRLDAFLRGAQAGEFDHLTV